MGDVEKFFEEGRREVKRMGRSASLRGLSRRWIDATSAHKYVYHFTWLGLPIIQLPGDVLALQEIVWRVKPELVVETGVARGGSLALHASILELLGRGRVLGIDIDIRKHNRALIEKHPLSKRITLIEGSSVDPRVAARAARMAKGKKTLVVLDSRHSHAHVLAELKLYAPLVSKGSYLIVFDTVVEDMKSKFPGRPWGKGDNPKTAVWEFLKSDRRFAIDASVHEKLLLTSAPDGYLKRVK